MNNYSQLPTRASLRVRKFEARVPEEKLQHFKRLLELSPVAPSVFESCNAGRRYGLERDWLKNAKQVWLNEFDWRKQEQRMNSIPNFKAIVRDGAANEIDLHFLALFSERRDAIPIVLLHGWPGSICEFLDILDLLKSRYHASDLPYHIVVPSLPGYAYSSGPPIDSDYGVDLAAGAIHNLMVGLGFDSGYLAQGGDLGSFICRILAMKYDACKGIHVNMMAATPPENPNDTPLSDADQEVWQKATEMIDTGMGFLIEQGTRAATIGFVLSSSPLALLSWIGEKFLAWSDQDPPLERILESVTLYWLTDTISRCLYHNRGMGDPEEKPNIARISMIVNGQQIKLPYIEKPTGYSLFAKDIVPVPKSWAATSCNLVSFNQHDKGGHFAAMERPAELLTDVENYVKKVWSVAEKGGE